MLIFWKLLEDLRNFKLQKLEKHIKIVKVISHVINEVKNQIEALLFASGRKMTIEELKMHLTISSASAIKDALEQLQKEYDEQQSSIMLVQEDNFWKLTTREKYLPLVRKINPNTELTKTMMETLAVIAWKQPITQSEVIAIRTNKAYEHIAELEKMGFLIKEKYGRTFMLKLTEKFFDYFDLRDAQAAREMFKHIKGSEETQKKLEEAVITEEEEQDIEISQNREEMIDEDEIKPEEASFVQGYEKDVGKTLDHSIIQPMQEKKNKQKK